MVEIPPKVGTCTVLLGDASMKGKCPTGTCKASRTKKACRDVGKNTMCVCTSGHMWQLVETQDVLAILSYDCRHNYSHVVNYM